MPVTYPIKVFWMFWYNICNAIICVRLKLSIMPDELVEKILQLSVVAMAIERKDEVKIHSILAVVCRRWRQIIDGDVFQTKAKFQFRQIGKSAF